MVSISAVALADPNTALDNSVVNQESNEYTVRAIGNNAPTSLINDVERGRVEDKYVDSTSENIYTNNTLKLHYSKYYAQNNIFSDSKFVSEKKVMTNNINRVYDFKVTDIKDIDWKNIFRKSTTTSTNIHSGNAYYSGVKKWNIYTAADYNKLETRTVSEIGATKQQTLPVGPYKNISSSYVKAPKLGYKFSFDLKTTGAKSNKTIEITPRFYYISKDGSEYIKKIKLFYKNSNNKYVDIKNYDIYFIPNDGYRLTFDQGSYKFYSSNISKATQRLGNTQLLTLNDKMMEVSDNTFVQIWYGEYKLPNSTIAVKLEDNGTYNINNPLRNGYIGIVFDIKVKQQNGPTISYSQNNTLANNNDNTSQWDYEGFLGFLNPGTKISDGSPLKLQLEKGSWRISNTVYNEIKGTVMLYDTDLRASSDYE